MFGINYFSLLDYVVVAGTLAFSLGIGVYHAVIGNQTSEDILVGGRNMQQFPIAVSMLVTYLSSITILGFPAEVYANGIQVFMMCLVFTAVIPFSIVLFVKPFYKMKLTSVYEYLERRFDSSCVRILAASTFILQIMLWNAIMLYAPAIALETIMDLPVWLSITGLGIVGTIYTAFGGIKAVVWADCFQFGMIAFGLLAMIVTGFSSAGGVSKLYQIMEEKNRLGLFDFNVDPFQRLNFWNIVLGLGFAMMTSLGSHQPQVQRYCSLPTLREAVRSMLLIIPINLFTMGLVLLAGISIFATYGHCCPILLGRLKKADSIAPYFVVDQMAYLPGLLGLFVSCVFSAVLSSISSTLNSLAAVTWEDIFSKYPKFSGMKGDRQARMIKTIVAPVMWCGVIFMIWGELRIREIYCPVSFAYGALTILLAFGAQYSGQIHQASMTAYGATSGPLGGIFVCALFLPCINKWGAKSGLVVGLFAMFTIGIRSLLLPKRAPNLGTDVEGCPNGTDFSAMMVLNTTSDSLEIDWPDKAFTISYTLYSAVGAVITVVVAMIFSAVTGGFRARHHIPVDYLHPMIVKKRDRRTRVT